MSDFATVDISKLTLEQLKKLADKDVLLWASTDLYKPPLSELSDFEKWATLLDTFLTQRKANNSQTAAQLASALLMLMRRNGGNAVAAEPATP